MSKINIHQAFYGEVNRSHGCIKQTVTDPELTTFLITFTDRPAALPPGTTLLPYLSGGAFSKYFVFTKTFPDDTASRAGMVFTHVLILDIRDVEQIDDLQKIFALFAQSPNNKPDELANIQVDLAPKSAAQSNRQQPKYIQQVLAALIKGESPVLFSGDLSTFSSVLQQIWNCLERKSIKFRSSFTPADIENVQDLTLVSIQKELRSKWQGRSLIQEDDREIIEVTSPSELLLLGDEEESSFHHFIIELNADKNNVKLYGQYEKIYNNYSRLNELTDANTLRQDIRSLTKISPNAKDGKKIKGDYIDRLSELIDTGNESNIKALRNIDWSAFHNGSKQGEQLTSQLVLKAINERASNDLTSLSEVISLAANEPEANWWHAAIKDSLNKVFSKGNESSIGTIWQLIDLSEEILKAVFTLINSGKDTESILRKYIPKKLKTETCKNLALICQKEKWYLLHADVLLQDLSAKDALEKQLKLEHKLPLNENSGVTYLSAKLKPTELIELAIKLSDKKLIEISVNEISKDAPLLKDMDLSIPCWLDMWTSLVLRNRNTFWGLAGKESQTVFSVLDLLIEGKTVSLELLGLIAESNFADLSEYNNRGKTWKVIPAQYKDKFIASSLPGILTRLFSGEIEGSSIEEEIIEQIVSDKIMTQVLSNNRNNIDPVITIYSNFGNKLKDTFLSDYITNYRNSLTEAQATALGRLVIQNGFSKSARSIYDKSRHNNSFTPAYEICQSLISFNLFESFFRFGASPRNPSKLSSGIKPIMTKEHESPNNLPTIVILTAIHEEYKAVRANLVGINDADRNDTSYEEGIFNYNNREIARVIIRECGARNTNASQETERAIQYFRPDMMLFVGIAGSRKPNDFSIGDVIFPDKIYSYEGGKAEKDSFKARPDLVSGNYALYEKAKKERGKDDWKVLVKGNWEQEFKADLGIIASGEQLIEHYDSAIGQILTDHYNDTSAIEMEGFGFAKAASRQGRETSNIIIGVVRGISDVIEQSSKSDVIEQSSKKEGYQKSEDRRPANAKMLASDTAAAFAFWLILKVYE